MPKQKQSAGQNKYTRRAIIVTGEIIQIIPPDIYLSCEMRGIMEGMREVPGILKLKFTQG